MKTKVYLSIKVKLILSLLIVSFAYLLLNPRVANAQSFNPDGPGNTFPTKGQMVITKYTPGSSGLNAPRSTVRVFYNTSSENPDYQNHSVLGLELLIQNVNNSEIKVGYAGVTETSTDGEDMTITFTKDKLRKDPKYPTKYSFIDISIFMDINRTQPAVGVIARSFQGGGQVTYKELEIRRDELGRVLGASDSYYGFATPPHPTRGPYEPAGDPYDYFSFLERYNDKMALLPDNLAPAENTYVFAFKTDCQFTRAGNVAFRWYDADSGPLSGNQSDRIQTRIFKGGTQVTPTIRGNGIGDNDSYREMLATIDPGTPTTRNQYLWFWENVDRSNGIQLWLPFNEITNDGEFVCEKDPTGGITNVNCSFARGWARDSDDLSQSVQYRMEYKGTDGNWRNFNPAISGLANEDHNITQSPPGHDFMKNNPQLSGLFDTQNRREFRLFGRSILPGGGQGVEIQLDYKVFTHSDCSRAVDIDCNSLTFRVPSGKPYEVYMNGKVPSLSGNSDYSGVGNGSDIAKNLVNDRHIVTGIVQAKVRIFNDTNKFLGFVDKNVGYGSCYVADCSISVTGNVPNAPPNSVKGGELFTVTLTIRNTGLNSLPVRLYNGSLSATINGAGVWVPQNAGQGSPGGPDEFWGFYPAKMPTGVDPGGQVSTQINIKAPDGVGSHALGAYADYWFSGGPFGPLRSADGTKYPNYCGGGPATTVVNTFKRFDITPTATVELVPDDESPNQANFNFSAKNSGWLIQANTVRTLTKNGTLLVTQSTPETIGDFSGTMSGPTNTPTLGDEYCGKIVVSPAKGWAGPFQTIPDPDGGSAEKEDCQRVANKPYVRAYGADVTAGGGFGTSCSDNNAFIKTYTRPIGELATKSGSGVQLAAMALGEIRGFLSATLRDDLNPPTQPRGLTFANTDPTTVSDAGYGPLLGGNMSGDGWCKPDYYQETQYPDNSKKSDNVTNWKTIINTNGQSQSLNDPLIANEGQSKINPGPTGSVTLNGMSGYGKRHTMYVEGDVFIASNITYKDQYNATNEIPNFTLVVKGNIYIANTVTTLDGLYIAQPNDAGKKGIIYTCATGVGVAPNSSQLFSDCGAEGNDKQLRVNGAFIAQRVVLNRTGHTLRESAPRESANDSKAAEIFNFSPEVYLSPPVFNPRSTLTSGEYKYITTLPPIL